MGFDALLSSLMSHVASLPSGAGRKELLASLQVWLRTNVKGWNPAVRARYGLDDYCAADLDAFPVEKASLHPQEELQQLRAFPPTTMETMAMRIRDVFWDGITVESSMRCPRCGETQLRILEDPRSERIVLACDLCAWAQTPEGETWQGPRALRPASKERVEGF